MRPEGGWYGPLAGFFCAALLAAACLLFVSMLGTAIGPFRFDSLLQEGAGSRPLGVWHPASARALAEDAAVQRWRAVLPDGVDVVESGDLAELAAARADPIVVADARALAADEIDALLAQARSGATVVLAGWIATRDAGGGPRAGAAMARLLDVSEVASVRSRGLARAAQGALASGLGPEGRLELPAESAVPALPEPAELCWTDARGAPARPACGALRLVRTGSGTLLWIAALPPPGTADPSWRALYRSALAAALRRPAHELLGSPAESLSGEQLEAWKAARADVRSELDSITRRRVRLRVSNEGTQRARAIAVRVYLNRRLVGAQAHSSTLFTSAPELRRALEHVDLALPAIPAGASRTYFIDVEP